MDFKRVIPILALIGVFVYGGVKLKKGLTRTMSASSTSSGEANVNMKKSLARFIREPRTDYKTLVEADQELPKVCAPFFEQLQALDMLAFKQDAFRVQYQNLPSADPACIIADPHYEAAEKAFFEKCVQTNPNKNDVISNDCAGALFMMRATVTRVLLKDKSVSEIKDLRQLSDLLFAEFSGNFDREFAPNFLRLKAVADRMLEINPNLYVAAKVSSYSDIFEGISKKDHREESWAAAEASLQRAETMNPKDPSMWDAAMVVRTRGMEPAKTVEYAQALIQKDPQDAKAHFLLAYGQWKSELRNASVATLQKAIDLSPENEEYKKTLATITQTDANADSFQTTVTVGVSSGDFEE